MTFNHVRLSPGPLYTATAQRKVAKYLTANGRIANNQYISKNAKAIGESHERPTDLKSIREVCYRQETEPAKQVDGDREVLTLQGRVAEALQNRR